MMYNGNKILKTEFVIRYLLGRIRQSGPEPELLPGEMELCAQLNVSRVTVRRALESLSAANYIIRLPKRKGAFSNPEMAKNVPCTIGIVASGCPFQMNGSSAISLSSFLKKMGACELFSWEYVFLSINPDDDPDPVILNNNLQGLFWISPPAGCYPAIRRLIGRRFPVVCIAMPYDSYHPVLEQNMILRDYASSGETLARFFHENALSNPVYCGLPNLSFERFVSGLRQYGIVFNPENLIAEPGEIERKLPFLIEKNGIDSIASDGGFARYNIITKLLSAHPEARRIALVMERSADTLHYRNDYPNLNIKLNPMDTISDYMCRAGTRAGEMFQKLIRRPGTVCNSIAV